jgi:hypothetical protein
MGGPFGNPMGSPFGPWSPSWYMVPDVQQYQVANVEATLSVGDTRESDVQLSWLPYSHIYARTCDLYTWVCRGSRLVLAQSRETLADDLRREGHDLGRALDRKLLHWVLRTSDATAPGTSLAHGLP